MNIRTISSIMGFLSLLTIVLISFSIPAKAAEIMEIPFGGWSQINQSGFGDTNNFAIRSLERFRNGLYAGTANESGTGAQLWWLNSSGEWTVITYDGFGDSNNLYDYLDNGTTVFESSIYVGTLNEEDGGEIWSYLSNRLFLPMVVGG